MSMKTGKKREVLFFIFRGRCYYCFKKIQQPDSGVADHVLPRSHGGRDNLVNRVLVCRKCDSVKKNFTSLIHVFRFYWKHLRPVLSLVRIFVRVEWFKFKQKKRGIDLKKRDIYAENNIQQNRTFGEVKIKSND